MTIRCPYELNGKPCKWKKDVHIADAQDEMDKHRREVHKPDDKVIESLHPKKSVRDYHK